ncbi:MAG: sirohydrochlorin chelatase, partial [Bacillota bacterium]|nr:sirohydrochlorin chelatase [Bacillota bacterium]
MEGIVYVAHGSRRASGNAGFISFIRNVMASVDCEIQNFGFLENATPSILQAIEQCIESGANEITIVPILLLPGIHAKVDIPAEIHRAKIMYPHMSFRYGTPLGSDEVMMDMVLKRLTEKGFGEGKADAVLLVGHGSREAGAAMEFVALAEMLRVNKGIPLEIGYLTTSPDYGKQAKVMLEKASRKLFVVPFLLYSGGFTVKMNSAMALLAADNEVEIVMCD